MKILSRVKSHLSPNILIYQMGKVGSTSIYSSLKKIGIPKVLHLHRLSPEATQKMKQIFLDKKQTKQWEIEMQYEEIYRSVIRREKKIKIISLVREPISRNISAFFENIKYKLDNAISLHDLDVSDLIEKFIKEYHHNVPLDWFDREMKVVTGIDVFQKEFNQSAKYQLYKNKNIELLLMRSDLEDSKKAILIQRLLRIKDFEIIRANIGAEREGKIYEIFKEKICIPESYLDNMLESKFTKHFYSLKEIETIRKKWQRNYDTQ